MNPDIKVGNIITAYYGGYHRVTQLYNAIKYGNNCAMVEYVKVVNINGTMTRGAPIRSCHISYCELVDPQHVYLKDQNVAYVKLMNLMIAILETG